MTLPDITVSQREGIELCSLRTLCGTPIEILDFLELSIAFSRALADLHRSNIIHQYLCPDNVFFDRKTGMVSLSGHTSSVPDTGGIGEGRNSVSPAFSPAYTSPEQIGRINRLLDHRTDLYSAGVILYQLLTGTLPFVAADILEWAHCHIARVPKSPRDVNSAIPSMLSDIVMKLLAKAVEERYQTALGLQLDLEHCLELWKKKQGIDTFPLGAWDISDRLLISQKLFGRESELTMLQRIFDNVAEGGISELVMITGYAGIGKTALVREFYRSIVGKHAFFLWGKTDQFQQNIPYGIIIDAFQDLVRQLLAEQELSRWKTKLQQALGVNGRLLIDILPQIELIIGPQPRVPEIPLNEIQHRFNRVFGQFIRVFATESHPLVIFLDDLQWIDPASLKLFESVVLNQDMKHLLVIGAYRDNEVEAQHPLMETVAVVSRNRPELQTIHLDSLSFTDLGCFLADTFYSDPGNIDQLTRLVHEKTAGNPFFVIQFLMMLSGRELIAFDPDRRCWTWEIERIKDSEYMDNVVDLMVAKLQGLPEIAWNALRLASCIGNRFDLKTLAVISGVSENEANARIAEGIREGLLLPLEGTRYAFAHDRVQQAAYSLIAEGDRADVHVQIGCLLLDSTPPDLVEDMVFELVSHLNHGLSLFSNRQERYRVAELNLMAGRKARESTAYHSAWDYLSIGLSLVNEEAWDERFDLIFRLCKELAVVEYLRSNYPRSEELIFQLIGRAKTVLGKADLYNTLIVQYTLRAKYQDAIRMGREALALLDIFIPETDFKKEYGAELERYFRLLGNRSIASLADDPEMSDPRMRAGLTLLANMLVPARYSDSTLFTLINIVMVNLSLEYGPTAKSAVGFAGFGIVLNAEMKNCQDAYQFGLAALKVSERFNDPAQKCQACFVLGHFLSPWVGHLKQSDDFNGPGLQVGLSAGEMQWTGYLLAYKLFQPFYRGEKLARIAKELPELFSFTRKTKNKWGSDTLVGLKLALTELQGQEEGGQKNAGGAAGELDAIDKPRFLDECHIRKSYGAIGRYAVLSAQIHYLFHRLDRALEAIRTAQRYQGYFSSSISVAALNFFHSLILAARYDEAADVKESGKCLEQIRVNQQEMKFWSDNCKENFEHQFILVQAELARIEGSEVKAEHLYEQAIESAGEYEFIQDQAIALERAAEFYRQRGLVAIAAFYLKRARDCYRDWGGEKKARQLDRLLPEEAQQAEVGGPNIRAGQLDAIAVARASQAISGEILLERLLETLLKIMLENAGAQKGCLLLAQSDELSLAATAQVSGQEIIVDQHSALVMDQVLPETLATYVRRTRETIMIDDVQELNTFSSDPYFFKNQPQSLLCVPLLRQADLIGILYLENSLVKRAFTADRIAILELLAAQAVISIENAVLYRERSLAEDAVRKSEEKYRLLFENSGTGLIFVEDNLIISGANKEFEKLTGYSKEEIEGRMLWPTLVADDDVREKMIKYHRTRRIDPQAAPQTYEFRLIDKAGRIKDTLLTVAMIPGKRQSLAAASDISELKRAEGEVARMVTVIEQSPEAVFITDTEFAIRYVNPAFERMSGYTKKEIIGQNACILDGDDEASLYQQVRKTLESGEIWSGRLSNRNKDNTFFDAEVTASPVRDKSGNIINHVCISRDITHEVQLERDLRQAHKMEAIGTLAGGIAHDFNNILTSIIGYTEMAKLRLAQDRNLVEQCLDQVLKSGNRAAQLVGQILTFGRQSEHRKKPVQVTTVVSEVLNLLRSSLPTTIEISRDIKVSDQDSMVMADATQIHQVVMNLGTNAAHAMRAEGGRLYVGVDVVTFSARSSSRPADLKPGAHVLLTVKDTGHGMNAKVMERIFDPYFTTKGPGEGSGIGLTVVQGIVNGHGGVISVKSKPKKGSEFKIFLPQIDASLIPDDTLKQEFIAGNERILFVDDEQALVSLGVESLENYGYRVTGKTNSVEAWNAFRSDPGRFDLLITDMTMPGLTGVDLAKKTRGLKADLPVILCTGYSETIKGKNAEKLGVSEVVMKPYQTSDIVQSIHRVCNRKT